MSNYRDDTQETAIISDAAWLGVSALTGESVKAADTVLFGLAVQAQETATVSDEVMGSAGTLTTEQASALDAVDEKLHASVLLQEPINITQTWQGRIRVLHEDAAQAADEVVDRINTSVSETAQAADQVLDARIATSTIAEQARISDRAFGYRQDISIESATAADSLLDTLHSADEMTETGALSDALLDSRKASAAIVVDSAFIAATVLDALRATDTLKELAVVEDWTPTPRNQAWTANSETWAMSRYNAFASHGLTVINGALYAMQDDGLYKVQSNEAVTGLLATGKLDLGQGALVHPRQSYLEYELEGGSATLDVTTTQGGLEASYAYPLAPRVSNELTQGRFVLGRGLRGRHFRFTLHITGRHAHINDWRIVMAPTKRRL